MSFRAKSFQRQSVPPTREKAIADGGAWQGGALLLENASGEWAECGANPAAIGAVAMHPVGAGSGPLYPVGTREFPPGFALGMLVASDVPFTCLYTGTLPAATGGNYDVVNSSGVWKVNFDSQAAARVKLVDKRWTESPLSQSRVVVTFLPANVQLVGE